MYVQPIFSNILLPLQTSTTTTFYVSLLTMIISGSFGHCLLLYCVATTNTVKNI